MLHRAGTWAVWLPILTTSWGCLPLLKGTTTVPWFTSLIRRGNGVLKREGTSLPTVLTKLGWGCDAQACTLGMVWCGVVGRVVSVGPEQQCRGAGAWGRWSRWKKPLRTGGSRGNQLAESEWVGSGLGDSWGIGGQQGLGGVRGCQDPLGPGLG